MKQLLLVFACVLSIALADTQWAVNDPNHYVQHQHSVDAAKQKAGFHGTHGSLQQVPSHGNLVGSSSLCETLCEGGASEVESLGGGVSGVGLLYPSAVGGSGFSQHDYSSSSSSTASGGGGTIVLPGTTGGSSNIHSSSSHITENVAGGVPFVTVPSGGGSESFQHFEQAVSSSNQPSGAVVIPLASSGGTSGHYVHHEQSSSSNVNPTVAVVPTIVGGGSSSNYVNEQQITASNLQPSIAVIPTPSNVNFHQHHLHHQQLQQHPSPVVVQYPTVTGGSSHYHKEFESHSQDNAAPTVVTFTPAGGQSSHVYKKKVVVNQGGGGGAIVAPIVSYPAGSSSSYIHSSSSQGSGSSGLGGGVALINPVSTGSGFTHGSLIDTGFNSNPVVPVFSNAALLDSRFSGSLGSFGSHNSLNSLMDESKRLAFLQSQNLHASNSFTGSSTAGASHAANTGAVQFVQPSTYGGTKSWEKSSKWASQSEYDQTGTTKSNSFLTTAEGEEQNQNGKLSGYKAATTTVENDGKTSTYSVYT